MESIEISASVNPLDVIKHFTNMYKVRNQTVQELTKILEESRRFNKWISEKRWENKEIRDILLIGYENQQRQFSSLINDVMHGTELTENKQQVICRLLEENTKLAKIIAGIRIKKE